MWYYYFFYRGGTHGLKSIAGRIQAKFTVYGHNHDPLCHHE